MPVATRLPGNPRRALAVVAMAAIALLVAACGPAGEPDITVGRAQAAEPTAGFSQVVADVTNRGDGPDRLVEATTDVAFGVQIHVTEIVEGRATMGQLDDVEIPAGETVRFRPGGLHLMLVLPDESVAVGGTFHLTLRFERSGEVTVPVEVVELLNLAEDAFDDTDG